MKLKEEWRESAKNKGEPSSPPSFLFEPWRGARVGSHRCPVLRVRLLKSTIENPKCEEPFRPCDGVDSPLQARESLRLFASSMCPLDLVLGPGVFLIVERRGARRTIE